MRTWMRVVAPAVVFSFALAACGGGDGGRPGATEVETEAAPAAQRPAADAKLDLGYILSETGPLAFLGPPMIQGTRLAVDNINRAGGVLGQQVPLATGDEAGDAARVKEAAARQINQGVDAVVGAAASGMSQEIIQILRDNRIVQCSPSNTSPAFSTQENADFYFRTVPPDEAVAPIIANRVISDGAQKVVVLGRADDYGRALSNLVAEQLSASGANVPTPIIYDPKAATFTAEVQQATSQSPDAVVLISFDEGAQIMKGLLESGIPPSRLYGGDGLFGPSLPEKVDPSNPSVIDGMTVIGASGGRQFNERLNQTLPPNERGNFIYGGQSYDCVVLIALAAEAARSVDPAVFVQKMIDVSRQGRPCSSFQECKTLLGQGVDIDYQGVSGPIDFGEVGDPTFGRYAIAMFQNGGQLVTVADRDVNVAEINR